MIRVLTRLFPLLLALVAPAAHATTYYLLSSAYNLIANHTTCVSGGCSDFAPGQRVSGSFSTAVPLAANLANAEISGQITGYLMSDGVNTYTHADPNARINAFFVSTDASGRPAAPTIALQRWHAAAPHTPGSRVDLFFVGETGAGALASQRCSAVGTSSASGVADVCTSSTTDTDSSTAGAQLGLWFSIGAPVPIPVEVPTTYAFIGTHYSIIANHTTCVTGPCGDYTGSMRVHGTLTLRDRLPPNLPPTFLDSYVTSFSFYDGLRNYFSGDAHVRVLAIALVTDGQGIPTPASAVSVNRWRTPAPHAVGNRIDMVQITGGDGGAAYNAICDEIGTALVTKIPDVCTSFDADSDTSFGNGRDTLGTWSIVNTSPQPVPALLPSALVVLAAFLGLAGALGIRRSARRS